MGRCCELLLFRVTLPMKRGLLEGHFLKGEILTTKITYLPAILGQVFLEQIS